MRGAALDYACDFVYGKKVSVIPLVKGAKKPAIESWKEYQNRYATADEMAHTWVDGCNLGIVTGSISGVVVVDCESLEDAKWFAENRGKTPVVAQTPRGFHLYFQHPNQHVLNAQRVRDESGNPRYDVRGDGGYVVAPPSAVDLSDEVKVAGVYMWGKGRELVSPKDLPLFNMKWRPDSVSMPGVSKRVADGELYIRHIKAVSGSSGHADTFRAVCRLKDSGMPAEDALAAMISWNQTNADPQWTLHELLHKVKSVYSE